MERWLCSSLRLSSSCSKSRKYLSGDEGSLGGSGNIGYWYRSVYFRAKYIIDPAVNRMCVRWCIGGTQADRLLPCVAYLISRFSSSFFPLSMANKKWRARTTGNSESSNLCFYVLLLHRIVSFP